MSKPLKKMMSDSLREKYEGVDSACVVDVCGLNVQKTQAIRRDLTQKHMRMRVVNNSMARLAFAGGPLEPLARSMRGPCALVTGGDSIVEVAKALLHWSKEHTEFGLKYAIVDGDAELMEVASLSKMMSRRELIADIAMRVSSPGRAVAGCVQSPAGAIAGCLKTLAEKSG